MKDPKNVEIIYFRENAIQSIISDTYMYGGILALLWFNHRYLSGNNVIDFLFIILMLMSAMARNGKKYKRFTSYSEMIEYLGGKEDAKKA